MYLRDRYYDTSVYDGDGRLALFDMGWFMLGVGFITSLCRGDMYIRLIDICVNIFLCSEIFVYYDHDYGASDCSSEDDAMICSQLESRRIEFPAVSNLRHIIF